MRVDLQFKPKPHQREAHAQRRRFNVYVWHRRAGKTYWALSELILGALQCPLPLGRYGYVDPFLKQAKLTAWAYLKDFSSRVPETKINESDHSLTFPNRSSLYLLGADNPDSLRGSYWDGVVLDEYADMDPTTWSLILRPALSDRKGWAIFIGTPKGPNAFQELYEKAASGESEEWGADLRTVDQTGMIDEAELESLKEDMRPNEIAQEFYCDFAAAASDTLISLVDASTATKRVIDPGLYAHAPRVMGIDVARMGDDQCAIARRQGLYAHPIKTRAKLDTMACADWVAGEIAEWEPDAVFLDLGGVGAGVFDRLRQLEYDNVIGVDFGGKAGSERYENKRAEMWCELASWLKIGQLPARDHELLTQVCAPKVIHRTDSGRLGLESKDSMKKRGLRSPDKADALALTFAFPVRLRADEPMLHGSKRHHALTDYDPLAKEASCG